MTSILEKRRTALAIFLVTIALAVTPALGVNTTPIVPPPGVPASELPYEDEMQGDFRGSISGDSYVAPSGAYRITIPVIPQLGGEINDSQNVVTFQDAFGKHITIGCFPLDATLRAEETKRGRKEFLVWFFQAYIQSDFARNIPGTTVEPNAKFINGTQGGTLFTQLLLPNGSVFTKRVFIFPPETPPVAKRGNFVFLNNGHVYVLSIELADRIFKHSTYNKTVAEEEEILRRDLLELLGRISFSKTTASAAANSTTIDNPGAAASGSDGNK